MVLQSVLFHIDSRVVLNIDLRMWPSIILHCTADDPVCESKLIDNQRLRNFKPVPIEIIITSLFDQIEIRDPGVEDSFNFKNQNNHFLEKANKNQVCKC